MVLRAVQVTAQLLPRAFQRHGCGSSGPLYVIGWLTLIFMRTTGNGRAVALKVL